MSHRVVLITGANGGLGQAIARAFLEESESNRVWLGVRARREAADALSAAHPDRCRVLELEVTDRAAWSSGVAEIVRRDQRLDVLVNNAGGHEDALLGTMEPASWDRVLAGNLDAVFHGCQAVLPTMISQKHGRIITIASLSALLPPAGQTNYAAAKGRRGRAQPVPLQGGGALGHHRQCRVPRLCGDRRAGAVGRGRTSRAAVEDPDAPVWKAVGGGGRGPLFGLFRRILHHRLKPEN